MAPFEKFLARVLDKLVSDLLGKRHNIIQWDRLRVLNDLQFVPVEDLSKVWMFINDLVHLVLGENFEDGWCSESQIYRAALFHEKCAIVDNTAFEKALDDEFLLFKLSVHLDHAR